MKMITQYSPISLWREFKAATTSVEGAKSFTKEVAFAPSGQQVKNYGLGLAIGIVLAIFIAAFMMMSPGGRSIKLNRILSDMDS